MWPVARLGRERLPGTQGVLSGTAGEVNQKAQKMQKLCKAPFLPFCSALTRLLLEVNLHPSETAFFQITELLVFFISVYKLKSKL